MVVLADRLTPAQLAGAQPAWSTSDQPALAHRHALTATYAGKRPNTLPQVLSLYGQRTAIFAGPGFLGADRWILDTADHHEQTDGCLAAATQAAADWRRSTPGPHALILHDRGAPDCPPLADALGPLAADTVWVVGTGSAGLGTTPAALLPPEPLPASSPTTLDLLPTLLTAQGATVPSDARGMDLRSPRPRRAVFFLGDGQVAIRTDQHRLAATVTAAGLEPAALTSAEGATLPLSDDAVAALMPALSAWHTGLSASTARERLGQDAFEQLLQDGGYWEAPDKGD